MKDSDKKKNDGVPRRPNRLRRALFVGMLASAGPALTAEEVSVGVNAAEILPKPGGFGKPVDTVKKDDRLKVLARQGPWLRVQTPSGRQGFIKEGALAAQSFSTATAPLKGDAAFSGLD